MTRRIMGFGCLAGGLLSAVVGIGLETQSEPWSGPTVYPSDLERAIGPLTHVLWDWAARIGVVALILSVILFVLSYWLLGPPRRNA